MVSATASPTPTIPTAQEQERLASVGLFYNPDPQPALICVECGFALCVSSDRVSRHLGERHGVPKVLRKGLNELVRGLALLEPQALLRMPNNSPPHPKLELHCGFACRHCRLPSSSLKVLDSHIRCDHADQAGANTAAELSTQIWRRKHIEPGVYFQSWGRRDVSRAWTVTLSDGLPKTPSESLSHLMSKSGPIRDFIVALEQGERARIGQGIQQGKSTARNPDHPNVISSWMRRTGWEPTFALARHDVLVALTGLPLQLGPRHWQHQHIQSADGHVKLSIVAADEAKVALIASAVDLLMDRCADTMRHSDGSVRRWLRSTRLNRPHRLPFELVAHATSERRYRSELKRFICLWLRLSLLPRSLLKAVAGRPLYSAQREALNTLWLHPVWNTGQVGTLHESTGTAKRSHAPTLSSEDNPKENTTMSSRAILGPQEDVEDDVDDDNNDDGDSDYSSESDDSSSSGSTATSVVAGDEDDDCKHVASHQQEHSYTSRAPTNFLPEALKDNAAVDVLLRFLTNAVSEDFIDGNPRSTLLVFYAAVRGLNRPLGDGFLQPHQYTGVLAGLNYCLRMICLEACLPRFCHRHIGLPRRPMRGQIDLIRGFHSAWMCDGTMSPLGELTSLLCFGISLRRAATPSFLFEWSDDRQTISWDGARFLTMTQLRGLAGKTLSSARERCLDLLYDWEPPSPDLKTIVDRLSCSSLGYSFVTNNANGLHDAYIQLLQRACASTSRGLLHNVGDGIGALWNIRAVMDYLDAHDRFLQTLMTLMQVTGGKPARVTELLTLEYSNSASRLRGLGVYRGRLFSLVRHHKARQRTNNEFHVARFYPPAVELLIYHYVVYIRPAVNVLVRECLPSRGSLGHLLFATASSAGSLSSGSMTREFRRLSSYVPLSPSTTAAIGTQLYRQLVTAIAEMHVKPAIELFNRHQDKGVDASPSAVLAWQAGHRPLQQATTYGLNGAFPTTLQPALLDLYLSASCLWHQFIGLAQMPLLSPGSDSNDSPSRTASQKKRRTSQLYGDAEEQLQIPQPKRPHYDPAGSPELAWSTMLQTRIRHRTLSAAISSPGQEDAVSTFQLSNKACAMEAQSAQPSAPPILTTALDGFGYNEKHGVAVCKICKTCLSSQPKAQERHLRGDPHRLSGQQLKAIVAALGSWVLKNKHQLKQEKPSITEPCEPIEGLALYRGFVCYCVADKDGNALGQGGLRGFCTRRWLNMQEHLSSVHGIKSKQGNDEIGRWRACMLQTYYTAKGLIDYFVVKEKKGGLPVVSKSQEP